jgi:sugar (pentulose or hexulose) kinase
MAFIFTADMGRSNWHMAVYEYTHGSGKAPKKVRDFPSIENQPYFCRRDLMSVERLDEAVGVVKGLIAGLEPEMRRDMRMIVTDSHGAAGYVLDDHGNPLFRQVYDFDVSKGIEEIGKLRGDRGAFYVETGTPQLVAGINWMSQIVYNILKNPNQLEEGDQITSMAGYVASRLLMRKGNGSDPNPPNFRLPSDLTHIMNHGYAWDIHQGRVSSLVKRLHELPYGMDIEHMMRDVRRQAYLPVGDFSNASFAQQVGIPETCRAISVAHDTSLAAELARIAGFDSFDSSGTWSCLIAPGKKFEIKPHMEQWYFTVNADVYGEWLPTVMFRGGEMWKNCMAKIRQTEKYNPDFDINVLMSILKSNDFILPCGMSGAGPYRHRVDAEPTTNATLLSNPVRYTHAVQLALALQTMFSEAAARRPLEDGASIADILEHPDGEKMLVAGPAAAGLSAEILTRVSPKRVYAVTDKTPVNLAGALVGAAALDGVKPSELQIDKGSLPINEITPERDGELTAAVIEYARRWEEAVRREAP